MMALDFDGTSDEIDCGSDSSMLNIFSGGGGTAMAWIFPQTFGELAGGYVISKGVSAGWHIQLNDFFATETISFVREWTTGDGRWNTPSNSIVLNVWQHIALTYDDGSAANNPIWYLDGESVSVTEDTTPSGSNISDSGEVTMIGNRPAGDRDFNGLLSELRLYTRILSAAEILSIYTQHGLDGLVPTVGDWSLSELGIGVAGPTSAGFAKDSSGNLNNGTLGSGAPVPVYQAGNGSFRRQTL